MRDYTKQPVHAVEDTTTRLVLSVIDYYLQDLSKGMARIQKGQVPDGSGQPIADQTLSDIYFVLKGRPTNQVGHGGTSPGGTLTLASTYHDTKGFVYFGNAGSAAFDEPNVLWGFGTATPTARVDIAVPAAVNQSSQASADITDNLWANSGGSNVDNWKYTTAVGAGNYILHPDSSSTSLILGFSTSTDPGVTNGFSFDVKALVTVAAGLKALNYNWDSGGPTWATGQVSLAGGTLGAGYTTQNFPIEAAKVSAINFSNIRFGCLPGGSSNGGQYQIEFIRLNVPPIGGGGSQVKVFRASDGTQTVDMDFLSDGGTSEALTLRPSGVGAGKLAIGSALPLIFATAGSSGDLWQRADSLGTGQWASASGLATRFYHSWKANGSYRVDADVDGAFVTPRACTLNRVLLYRRKAGSGGSTQVSLLSGGASALSAPITIAAAAGASASAVGTVSSASLQVSARLTVDTLAVDSGDPQDYDVWAEFY